MTTKLISLLLLIFSLAACNDDNNTSLNLPDINGTWKIISITGSGCIVGDDTLEFDENGCADDAGRAFCIDGQITFDNGNYAQAFDFTLDGVVDEFLSGSDDGTYTIEGNEITFCSTGANCVTGTINFENNELIISTDPTADCVEITKLRKI